MTRRALVCLLATACAATERPPAAPSPPPPSGRLHDISEVLARLHALPSAISAAQSSPDEGERFAAVLWPAVLDPNTPAPRAVTGKDGTLLRPAGCNAEAEAAIADGERKFGQRDWAGAAGDYARAAQLDPQCAAAFTYTGDCAFKAGLFADALAAYDKAAAINPLDFLPPFFRGDALVKLGRLDEARDAYIHALVLRPRRASILGNLKAAASQLRVRVEDEPLSPGAAPIGGSLRVARLEWLAYGLCKALWRVDPEHRRALIGSTDDQWTPTEERECLDVLVASYGHWREGRIDPALGQEIDRLGLPRSSAEADPALDRLERIFADGFADAYVTWEITSRITPFASLLLSDAQRADLERFVRRYVVVVE